MEKVVLNDNSYGFVKDFKYDEVLRQSFNAMTETHFGFSLEDWYQQGYWGGYYVPYALLDRNQVISNVSINQLEFQIEGETRRGIQVGTVMTHEKYRHRGLNKYLLQRVLEDWKDQSDFIYLFANDSVLNFYPKFGFERLQEYQYSKLISGNRATPQRKLNVEDATDAELLKETVNSSVSLSKIVVRNHASMILFYGLSFMKNSIYYLEEFKAIAIADMQGDVMFLQDVFAQTPVELDEVIQGISGKQIRKVVLGFTPLDTSGFDISPVQGADTLFMLEGQSGFFKNNHWMFPLMSHG